jgi:DNA-binding response OmpR family regulator
MKQQLKVTVGPLAIDRQHQSVRVGSRPIHLTPIGFVLLWTLAARPGAVYRREELLQRGGEST